MTGDLMPWMPPSVLPEANFVSPQVFLPFFHGNTGGTNTVGPGVMTSVPFIPPTRVRRAPSKATYATP